MKARRDRDEVLRAVEHDARARLEDVDPVDLLIELHDRAAVREAMARAKRRVARGLAISPCPGLPPPPEATEINPSPNTSCLILWT